MTIEITVRCDGLNCSNSIEIPSDNDEHIQNAGWGLDFSSDFHYCPRCWKKVKNEIDCGVGP